MLTNIQIIDIDFNTAKKLYQKDIYIQEKSSGVIFKANVVDHCSPEQTGLIVSLSKEYQGILKTNNFLESDNKDLLELDLRDIYNGHGFDFIGVVEPMAH